MLNQEPTYLYVDDAFALYVPANAQGFEDPVHNADVLVLTHKSLLPVSRCNRMDCAGVPKVALIKYNVSSLSREAVMVPLLRNWSRLCGCATVRRCVCMLTTLGATESDLLRSANPFVVDIMVAPRANTVVHFILLVCRGGQDLGYEIHLFRSSMRGE